MSKAEDFNIDPNVTPTGVSLEQIRKITRQGSERVRSFVVISSSHSVLVTALPTVYFCDDFGDSRYFAEMIPQFAQGRFLEIGTGTGVVAIAVALAHEEYFRTHDEPFVAIDINPLAVANAQENARSNGVEARIDFRLGDVFSPLVPGDRFDCIFWNHPFHKGNEVEDIVQRACFDPGYQGLVTYMRDGHRFLNDGGRLLLGSGNFADLDTMREIAARHRRELHLLHFIHRPFNASAGELKTFNIYEVR